MSESIVILMISVSTFLGALGLIALLWGVKTGQFDDQSKFIDAARYDGEEELRDAVMMEEKHYVVCMKQKLNVMVVPIFLPRVERGKYKLIVGDPIKEKSDIVTVTQCYNDAIEEVVRAYPEQWFWMHNRWKV